MDQAVMSLAGVLCGILASIPISIWLLMLLTRDRTAYYNAEGTIEPNRWEVVTDEPNRWEVVTDEPLQLDDGKRYLDA